MFFMISTDKTTQYSSDKVINSFVVASSYCAARLIGGGGEVTGLDMTDYSKMPIVVKFEKTGPLLNPAIAMG